MANKIERLQSLIKTLDESLTKEDFVKSFQVILAYMKKVGEKHDQQLAAIERAIKANENKTIDKAIKQVSLAIKEAEKSNDTILKQAIKTLEGKIDSIDDRFSELDVRDGEDADEERVIGSVTSNILEKAIEFEREMEERLQALEASRDEIKVDFDKSQKNKIVTYGPTKTKIIKLDLSDQLDGVTKTFRIGTHWGITGVESSSMPFGAFRDGVDYNEVAQTIVFTDEIDATIALAAGQSLIVKYLR